MRISLHAPGSGYGGPVRFFLMIQTMGKQLHATGSGTAVAELDRAHKAAVAVLQGRGSSPRKAWWKDAGWVAVAVAVVAIIVAIIIAVAT
jgi:hypothetical protein